MGEGGILPTPRLDLHDEMSMMEEDMVLIVVELVDRMEVDCIAFVAVDVASLVMERKIHDLFLAWEMLCYLNLWEVEACCHC